jgi:hypothetical protein
MNPGTRVGGFAAIALLLTASFLLPLRAQTAAEDSLKAAFLYKLASFVEWPQGPSAGPLCIGVIGQDPVADLDRVVQGKTVNGRPFCVRRFKTAKDAGACEIVFIGASERSRLQSVLEHLNRTPTLTVGDSPGFCEGGGMVNLHLSDDHVHLQINLAAVERSNLQLSSKLLSLASIVRSGDSMGSK